MQRYRLSTITQEKCMESQRRNTNRRRESRRHQEQMQQHVIIGLICLIVAVLVFGVLKIVNSDIFAGKYRERIGAHIDPVKPEIDVQLLTINPYSRPGIKTDEITGIVVHYTANPGATAIDNRNYFESLKDGHDTQVSSNFVIGLEGEIVQCVPTWEMAYASNSRNIDTVSIECCHPDETGKFNEETYKSMVQLCAWLCLKFGLNETDVIRHYDVTGKNCPKYFVENEKAWDAFQENIRLSMKNVPES